MKNEFKCIDCNKNYPCWMIVEYPPVKGIPVDRAIEDHPLDKKTMKKCIMDRKAEAHFVLQVKPNVSK